MSIYGGDMGHKNRKTLIRQVSENLDDQFRNGKGRMKHYDKQTEEGTKGRIYSDTTLKTYKKHCCYFVKWCKAVYKCKTLEECRDHASEWIESRSSLSAWTLKTEASALAKLYYCSAEDLGIKTPERKRSAIKRSRGRANYDKHFSEKNNAALNTFGKCTGLRRAELKRVRGTALFFKGDHYYLRVTDGTKGGRKRDAIIVGAPEDVAEVVRLCKASGNEKIFPKVHKALDEHSNRRLYAQTVYKMYERPLESLSKDQKYFCRGDFKGKVYDRRAMMKASEALGHGRLGVIASNYL